MFVQVLTYKNLRYLDVGRFQQAGDGIAELVTQICAETGGKAFTKPSLVKQHTTSAEL
jgi:hypothetical protein